MMILLGLFSITLTPARARLILRNAAFALQTDAIVQPPESSQLEQLGDLDQFERRIDAQLYSRRHVHDQREAPQGLDGNVADRLLAAQNLLGLVTGKCPRIGVVADQSHEGAILADRTFGR